MAPTTTTAPERLTRKQKQAQTRQRLLEAAARVFVRRGFAGASVEEIAAEAGYTRGAFYSNFKSKEELFIELLHDRIFSGYRRDLAHASREATPRARLRAGAEAVRDVQAEGRTGDNWLFALWLECLVHAVRDPEFRKLAATFWSGNRSLTAGGLEALYKSRGAKPPIEPKHLATAMTALDIGLAIQHMVDPDEVPLDVYVPLYELLFGDLVDPEPAG